MPIENAAPLPLGCRVCDVTNSEERLTVPAAAEGIGCLAFSLDGSLIAAGGAGGHVQAWETATGKCRCDDQLELSPLSLAFSPDSRRLAAVNREVVTIWDLQTGKGILTLRGSPPRPTDLDSNATLTWSRDGRWLAAVNWDGTVALWDGGATTTLTGPIGFRACRRRESMPGISARPRRPGPPGIGPRPHFISTALPPSNRRIPPATTSRPVAHASR